MKIMEPSNKLINITRTYGSFMMSFKNKKNKKNNTVCFFAVEKVLQQCDVILIFIF